jgi:hypothetical protein
MRLSSISLRPLTWFVPLLLVLARCGGSSPDAPLGDANSSSADGGARSDATSGGPDGGGHADGYSPFADGSAGTEAGPACDNPLDRQGCSCPAGSTPRSCYTGPASQAGVGSCKMGTQACTGVSELGGTWGACTGQGAPITCAATNSQCGTIWCGSPESVWLLGEDVRAARRPMWLRTGRLRRNAQLRAMPQRRTLWRRGSSESVRLRRKDLRAARRQLRYRARRVRGTAQLRYVPFGPGLRWRRSSKSVRLPADHLQANDVPNDLGRVRRPNQLRRRHAPTRVQRRPGGRLRRLARGLR